MNKIIITVIAEFYEDSLNGVATDVFKRYVVETWKSDLIDLATKSDDPQIDFHVESVEFDISIESGTGSEFFDILVLDSHGQDMDDGDEKAALVKEYLTNTNAIYEKFLETH
ncbi:MAG: hypothetical protein L0287_00630 [Anaerolineae bacterium]|nr:hypothetical protein [Anaerolineae bacterium]